MKLKDILDYLHKVTGGRGHIFRTSRSITFNSSKPFRPVQVALYCFTTHAHAHSHALSCLRSPENHGCMAMVKIVLRLYRHPAEVLIGFDVDACW